METHTPRRNGLSVVTIAVALGLVGCNSVYTIHSIAAPSDEPSTVPDVSGLWGLRDAESTSNVLRLAATEYDIGQCRDATIHSLGATSVDDELVGNEICFVPVAGHLIAQMRTTGQVQLYQQYLFRFDQESVSFCDAIWADLVEWSDKHLDGSTAHGLEFSRRGLGETTEMFVISQRDELLKYLEARLPAVANACDESDEEGHNDWITYIRLTPPRRAGVADAADTSPSPRPECRATVHHRNRQ